MIAVSDHCSAAIDSNSVVDRSWFDIHVEFPGHTNLTKVLAMNTPAPLLSALQLSCTPEASVYIDRKKEGVIGRGSMMGKSPSLNRLKSMIQ